MKLTKVIEVWDKLHIKDTGDIGFCDLEKAIDEVIGIGNNVPQDQPIDEGMTHQLPCSQCGKVVNASMKDIDWWICKPCFVAEKEKHEDATRLPVADDQVAEALYNIKTCVMTEMGRLGIEELPEKAEGLEAGFWLKKCSDMAQQAREWKIIATETSAKLTELANEHRSLEERCEKAELRVEKISEVMDNF